MKFKTIKVKFLIIIAIVLTACNNVTTNKKSLNEYATLAMNQAKVASDSGTFGVGGILLDLDGNIICQMHNQVIKGSRINDPTAHGERQIVDWYLENKEKENLPEPKDCILITSLDPCVMCTGALAQVGFNKVIVLALDDYAGINWQGNNDCPALEGLECQEYVHEHFVYPEVTGQQSRKAYGASLLDITTFSDITVTSDVLNGCLDAFNLSADEVRNKVSAVSIEAEDIINPASLDISHPIYKYLKESFGEDFLACHYKLGESVQGFLDYVESKYSDFDGIAYFDQFGNLLCLMQDDENVSTLSAFMKLTRKIARIRNTEPIDGYEINEYLHNPKYGYFVYMNCPEVSTKTIMELGAIGSTLENTSINPILYINDQENADALDATIAKLPPLYTEYINISFEHASNY